MKINFCLVYVFYKGQIDADIEGKIVKASTLHCDGEAPCRHGEQGILLFEQYCRKARQAAKSLKRTFGDKVRIEVDYCRNSSRDITTILSLDYR